MKKNVQTLKSKGRKVDLLYSESDLYDCFNHMESVAVNQRIKIDDNCEILLKNNSHVLGSCNATIYIRKPNSNRWKTLCYSSDMGSSINKKYSNYLKEQDIPRKCDIFISEATYSDNTRVMSEKTIKKEREEFIRIIKEGLNNGKQILLPTFAFSRSQQILTTLFKELKDEEWFKDSGMYIVADGTLMNNINKCYSRVLEGEDKKLFDDVMSWDKLKKIDTFDGTMALLSKREPRVILCSSGFLENGKVSIYLPQILGCSKDIIILTGYCSQNNEGSMGWKLVTSPQKTITFNGDKNQTVLKRAKIYQQGSWSSHITNQELKDLFASLSCNKIIIHHCDEENKQSFINDCNEYLRSKNKTTKIIGTSKCCNQFIL